MGPNLRAAFSLIDRYTAPMRRIIAAQSQWNATAAQSVAIQRQHNSLVAAGAVGFQGFAQQVRTSNAQMTAHAKANREFRISFLGMLRVMALFAINLQIIRAATSPATFLRGAISSATDFQQGLKLINVLLRQTDERLGQFGVRVRRLSGDTGIAADEILTAAREIASSVDSLNLGNLDEVSATYEIIRAGARGAVLDNTELINVASALRTTLAATQLPVENVNTVMDMLFATVDVGNLQFEDLNQNLGDFSGVLRAITAGKNVEDASRTLQEFLGVYAALSNVMPASEAATAVNRLFTSVGLKRTPGEQKLIDAVQKRTGADLSPQLLFEKGPLTYIQNLATALGPRSELIQKLVTGEFQGLQGEEFDQAVAANMDATSAQIISNIFRNVRAARPALLLIQEEGANVLGIYDAMTVSMQESSRAFNEAMGSMATQWSRLKEIFNTIKISFGMPIIEEATTLVKTMADNLNALVNTDAFDELSARNKVKLILDTVVNTFDDWWDSGGRQKVGGFTQDMVGSLLDFMQIAVVDNMDKIIAIGTSIAQGLVFGILNFIKDPGNWMPKGDGGGGINFGLLPAVIGGFLGKRFFGSTGRGIAAGFAGGGVLSNATQDAGGIGGMGLGLLGAGAGALMGPRFGVGAGGAALLGGALGLASGGDLGSLVANGLTGAALVGMLLKGNRQTPAAIAATAGSVGNRIISPAVASGRSAAFNRLTATRLAAAGVQIGGGALRDPATGRFTSRNLGNMARIEGWRSLLTRQGLRAIPSAAAGGLSRLIGGGRPGIFTLGAGTTAAQLGLDLAFGNPLDTTEDTAENTAAILGAGSSIDAISEMKRLLDQRPQDPSRFAQALEKGGSLIGRANELLSLGAYDFRGPDEVRRARQAEVDNAIATAAPVVAQGFGVNLPPGVMNEILMAGQNAGITSAADMAKFVAFNLAVMKGESGFDPSRQNKKDPGPLGSVGLYQLNTGPLGQGFGMSMEDLKDPVKNARIGANAIAQTIKSGQAGLGDLTMLARRSGHPGIGSEGIPFAQKIARDTQDFLARGGNADLFSMIQAGGVSGASGGLSQSIVVEGNLILQGVNPNDMDEFMSAFADALYRQRGAENPQE